MLNQTTAFTQASKEFKETLESIDLSKPVYKDGWNAHQIISHVIFYQEYYASIVEALAKGKVLPLINESLAKVNIESAMKYSNCSRSELISKFEKAQKTFADNIKLIAPNKRIPYKKGGSVYTAKGYLLEITRHMVKHTRDLNKGRKS